MGRLVLVSTGVMRHKVTPATMPATVGGVRCREVSCLSVNGSRDKALSHQARRRYHLNTDCTAENLSMSSHYTDSAGQFNPLSLDTQRYIHTHTHTVHRYTHTYTHTCIPTVSVTTPATFHSAASTQQHTHIPPFSFPPCLLTYGRVVVWGPHIACKLNSNGCKWNRDNTLTVSPCGPHKICTANHRHT